MNILTKIFKINKKTLIKAETNSILTPIKNNKILIISDIHFPLSEKEIEEIKKEYTQCWLLGDISQDVLKFISSTIKCPIYGVFGNHDTQNTFDNFNNIKNINGKNITENNISIVGIGGSSKYKENTPYVMLTHGESDDILKNMSNADVLISHDSANNIHSEEKNKEGLIGITNYIENKQPKLHIYGHHHIFKSYTLNKTLCICNYRIGVIEKDGIYHTV